MFHHLTCSAVEKRGSHGLRLRYNFTWRLVVGLLMAGLATNAQVTYVRQTSGYCTSPITSMSDCVAAAQALGMSDTSASDDGESGASYDPPYCYFEGSSLKFNSGGNTGSCGSNSDTCICQAGYVIH
eukprot:TRINITY_DN15478_c0_g1_i1.p1 TRINITY_DN15478_c0_g1~~TRINITY_DN15478_c0_g1_i1.p1  ORF type:complete len:127 (-),score=9.30 TRINITY_DN15478_c0_g1_i1:73-453(-)